ncbi:Similar to Vps25: Vacuolar protein-sorting-associated protein 25 (Drosophila melanogaster) [Cotesia congregata]|uniref:Vacuolar protein-sorting-associated protein 25 n=1 Tax=Cotesia congregata TaxID=51543 RepID=A0A8J2MW18_COTCN|nr:Similar to Vps25: Vacuolar protein-sorting-associated protein 25 (Drosophila melanogaster) [Cotesia congregata]
MSEIEWPWQYSFPPFFTLQPHAETKEKQLSAWTSLVLNYYQSTKQSILDQRWLIHWHTLEEWGNIVYNWAQENGFINSVCTLFELTQGENTVDQEFYGIDTEVLIRSLKTLEAQGKAELIMFDDNQGVKFF